MSYSSHINDKHSNNSTSICFKSSTKTNKITHGCNDSLVVKYKKIKLMV